MKQLGLVKLRYFTARPRTVYDTYYSFTAGKNVLNFSVPPLGRDIRVTNLKGEPICIGRRAVKRGRYRLIYQKITYEDQLSHAFDLLDQSFSLLSKVYISLLGGLFFQLCISENMALF